MVPPRCRCQTNPAKNPRLLCLPKTLSVENAFEISEFKKSKPRLGQRVDRTNNDSPPTGTLRSFSLYVCHANYYALAKHSCCASDRIERYRDILRIE